MLSVRLVKTLITFTRDSEVHETTNAFRGVFNACSFLKTGTNVWARAIQSVFLLAEDSDHHRPVTLRFNSHEYSGCRFWH